MPYVGIKNGTRVGPWQVEDDVICPSCQEPMYLKGGPDTERELHFCHYPDSRCGGESDEHRRMKAISAHKARNLYPDAEVKIEAKTGGVTKTRQADVLVTFDEPQSSLGLGIAIECQYRNEDKKLHKVARDHAIAGYSTIYVYEEHFSGTEVNLGGGDIMSFTNLWPPDSSDWYGPNPVEQGLRVLTERAPVVERYCRMLDTEAVLEFTWGIVEFRQYIYDAWFKALLEAPPERNDNATRCVQCGVTLPIAPLYDDLTRCPDCCHRTYCEKRDIKFALSSQRSLTGQGEGDLTTTQDPEDAVPQNSATEFGSEVRACHQRGCMGNQMKAKQLEVAYDYGWVCDSCGFHHGNAT